MTKTKRFSKAALATSLWQKYWTIQDKWAFNDDNGTVQLINRGTDAAVAYGEKEMLLRIIEEFNLD